MKSELEKAISAVKFRDGNKNDKYVFDITAHRRIGNGYESVDLQMKQRGVDILERTAEFAKENEFENPAHSFVQKQDCKRKNHRIWHSA